MDTKLRFIAENLSWKRATQLEMYLINAIGRRNVGKGPLVNLTDGGDGVKGLIMSEKSRRRISNSVSGSLHHGFGKHISEKTKRKMSKSTKNRILSEEWRMNLSKAAEGKKRGKYKKATL